MYYKVIGRRYKCTVCPDFDLCQSCESKEIRSKHNLIHDECKMPLSFKEGNTKDFETDGGRYAVALNQS